MHFPRSAWAWLSGCVSGFGLASALLAGELHLDAQQLMARGVGRQLELAGNEQSIVLQRGELFEDDGPAAGYSYQPQEERLSDEVWAKKELMIPHPEAHRALLLVGPGGSLQVSLNGQPCPLESQGKVQGYWQAYAFPPSRLVPGRNSFVLRGDGKLWIARDDEYARGSLERPSHPNRSAKSTDGGRTWDDRRLGPDGTVDGEYYVRVFLDHHRSSGELVLPVVDTGNLEGKLIAPPLAGLGPIRIGVDATAGEVGKIVLRARTGTVPVPDQSWSDWASAEGGELTVSQPSGRYLEVAVELATSDARQSPRLRSVVIEAAHPAAPDWTGAIKVLEMENQEIVRSAIPFEYEPFDHPGLAQLRREYKLDEVVAGESQSSGGQPSPQPSARGRGSNTQSEFERITRLAAWAARQWDRGHLQEIYPPWDALEILRPWRDGTPTGGFCQQRNLVFLQACESFGLVGRCVSIGAGVRGEQLRGGGHEVVEIWSNDHKKWVYVDGDMAWYFVDAQSKKPLSLWKLRERQLQALEGREHRAVEVVPLGPGRRTWEGLKAWPPFVELRLIPRSNFLQHQAPLPLNQGMRGWFWTGHWAWTDEQAPAAELYGHRVSHRSDWEWTLNQAHLVLEATEVPGQLRVYCDTQTPGFETFLVARDEEPKRPAASGYLWKLRPGVERLEVVPRNRAGVEGIASWTKINYRPSAADTPPRSSGASQ